MSPKRDPGLVCGLPCAYRLGSILPWPPEFPGFENWARGDGPTIQAYLHALGERVFESEKDLARIEQTLAAVPDTVSLIVKLALESQSKRFELEIENLKRALGLVKGG